MTRFRVSIGDQNAVLDVTASGDARIVSSGETSHSYTILWSSDHEMAVEHEGVQYVFAWTRSGNEIQLTVNGETWTAEVETGPAKRSRRKESNHSLSAPMPGSVLRVLTREGASVNKGDPLLVLEAMKMEHVIAAPYDGVVDKVACAEGQMVQPGGDLISITPADQGASE